MLFQTAWSLLRRIGALLLKGEWKAAVELIMGRVEGERSENDEARRLFLDKGDVGGALRLMQRHLTAERALLEVNPSLVETVVRLDKRLLGPGCLRAELSSSNVFLVPR